MNPPKVIQPPDGEWVTRLRCNDIVWAPKQDRFLIVSFAFEQPTLPHHHQSGRIGLRYLWYGDDGQWGAEPDVHEWFVKATGEGFDGNLILMPCAGYLADDPPDMSAPWVRRVETELAALRARVDQLEALSGHYHNPFDN